MSTSVVTSEIAEPYARALLSLTQDSGTTDTVNSAARSVLELLGQSQELADFLANPLASPDAKKGVLKKVLGDSADSNFLNFLQLLVDRGRAAAMVPVLSQYQAMVRDVNQTVLAEVSSAIELSDAQKESIRQKVMAMTEAKAVELSTELDASLLGGVIIKVGSQVIDASVRGQLRRIGIQLGTV
ncbi:MAG: F0F1 ATP synthase subunit delta [Moorea sp. SIO3C2]|nr:F0F1 ATP synthase subunit delta [Moorena sp. SIO3C2]